MMVKINLRAADGTPPPKDLARRRRTYDFSYGPIRSRPSEFLSVSNATTCSSCFFGPGDAKEGN